MANQEELQRITDSTLQELAAIVKDHIQKYQDQEKAALREELDRLKKEKDMKNEIRKSIEDSNQILTREITEVALHSKIQEETKEHQIRRRENSTAVCVMQKEQAKMFFYHAMESCANKEERYIRSIKKLNDYIHGLHSTLEQSGIFNGQCTNQSDQSEDSNEYESYESDDSNNLFEDNDGDDDYDELEKQSDDKDEESQESLNTVAETSVLKLRGDHYVAANPQESNWCDMIDAEELESNQQSQLDEPDNTDLPESEPSGKDEEASNTEAKTFLLESEELAKLQNDHCMVPIEELKLNQQSQSIEPGHIDLPESEPSCKNEESQEASNTEAENSVEESIEPAKSKVPQKIKLDPFVHSYGEVKFEEVKKPKKKQQKRKPKSKTKFSTLSTFGCF